MKRLALILSLCLLLTLAALPVAAQSPTPIAYGDTVNGEISNAAFEVLYTFKGKAGDLVSIQMVASSGASLDPYLFLSDASNTVLSFNDDAFSLNSQINFNLTADGDYTIIATRTGQRSGDGEGAYSLTLNKIVPMELGQQQTGKAVSDQAPPQHVFIPTETGVYTITYLHTEGTYFPALMVKLSDPDSFYSDPLANVGGTGVRSASLSVDMIGGTTYTISVEPALYAYFDTPVIANYSLQIDPAK